MRFYRYAIILVIIVALLTGAYFIIDKTTGSENTGDIEKIQLVQVDEEKVQSLTIKNSEGEFVFEKNGDTWILVSGGDFRIDVLSISNIASTIAELQAERIIEKNAKNFEKYGLSDAKVITLNTNDGETIVVELGNPTATNESYYLKLNEDNTIYTMPYYGGSILDVTKTDIGSKYVLDSPRSEVTKFGFEKDGQVVIMAKREEERDWNLTEPVEVDGNIANITNAIDAYIRTSIHDYVGEDEKDLAIYGLDKPLYTVETELSGEKSIKLLMGKEKGMNFETYVNETYAMFEGNNEVFLIDIEPLNFLQESLIHFANDYVYEEEMKYMEGAYAEIGDKQINLEIKRLSEDDKETLKYYVDGKEVAEDGDWNFRELYRTLMAVSVIEIDFDVEPPEEQAEFLITFYLNKEPKEVTIEFIPRDETTYYAMKDGQYTGLIAEDLSFEIISDTYEVLLDYVID